MYKHLNFLIYKENRKRYSKLAYSWNKLKTIKFLLEKIPELQTSFIKEVKTINDIDVPTFVLKNSIGHSARAVYVFDKTGDKYKERIRNKIYTLKNISDIIYNSTNPFIEKPIGKKIPYDIKVHIFFGKICFFYIYKKGNFSEKARYDSDCNYIPYETMFYNLQAYPKENKYIINNVDKEKLQNILKYSLEIFNNLDNLLYCSIDWLYDGDYSFCELTPTPFSLSKPIKSTFIQYIYKKCNLI